MKPATEKDKEQLLRKLIKLGGQQLTTKLVKEEEAAYGEANDREGTAYKEEAS